MRALRTRPRGAYEISFGIGLLVFGAVPSPIGHQDLAALIARQPAVAERGRQHLLASPFGTIHAAMFRFPRPLGASILDPSQFQLVRLNTDTGGITRSVPSDPISRHAIPVAPPTIQFPLVNRTLKGDMLVRQQPQPAEPQEPAPPASPTDGDEQLEAEINTATRLSGLGNAPAEAPGRGEDAPAREPTPHFHDENPSTRTARLFFGSQIAPFRSVLQPWGPGEAPILLTPHAADGDIKQAALTPSDGGKDGEAGQMIAGKGEVTGEGKRPKTPAERLGLTGKARARAEKCLTNAIYFEARGEPVRGQIAVAQVVLNRAFSGYYPSDICGVVYQNAHRRLACQFTFACDGIRDVVTEHDAWERAKRIAKDTLDGKLWVPEVDKSTHYHASWVRPYWIRTMKTMHKLGVHTFYRPRRWGNGSDAPSWGNPAATAEAVKNL